MILLKRRKFISKINRSNPQLIYVNKKKAECSIDANFNHYFKVRWNTTYTMLTRFVTLKIVVNNMKYNASEIKNISVILIYLEIQLFLSSFLIKDSEVNKIA